eukprot:13265750-Alexandrium_andersonii.AAC.1
MVALAVVDAGCLLRCIRVVRGTWEAAPSLAPSLLRGARAAVADRRLRRNPRFPAWSFLPPSSGRVTRRARAAARRPCPSPGHRNSCRRTSS